MAIESPVFYKTWPLQGKRFNLQLGESRHNWSGFYPVGAHSVQEVEDGATFISADRALAGFEFGDLDQKKRFRLFFVKASNQFVIQKNTGTDASPSWSTIQTVDAATDGVIFNGPVTGVTTYNGVDISDLSSRLEPGGADALALGTPVDIGSANSEGAAASFARSDHVHEGVHTVKKSGQADIHGDVTLSEGSRISLTQNSNDIEIALSIDETYQTTNADQTGITTETAVQFDTPDVGEGILFPGADGVKDYFIQYSVPFVTVSNAVQGRFIIHVGSTGTISDAIARNNIFFEQGTSRGLTMTFLVKVSNPSSSDVATLSVQRDSGTGTISVEGLSRHGSVRIWRAT